MKILVKLILNCPRAHAITYTKHDKDAFSRKLKDRFSPPLLQCCRFTVHTWAVKPKQHCTRGGEGGEFVPFGQDGCMERNWKLHWNASILLSWVVDFFCGGSEKSRFQWLHKEQFQNFLELYLQGRIYCFFNKFLILLGNRSRSDCMRGLNWNNYSWIPNSWTLIFQSSLLITRNKSRFPLLRWTL